MATSSIDNKHDRKKKNSRLFDTNGAQTSWSPLIFLMRYAAYIYVYTSIQHCEIDLAPQWKYKRDKKKHYTDTIIDILQFWSGVQWK